MRQKDGGKTTKMKTVCEAPRPFTSPKLLGRRYSATPVRDGSAATSSDFATRKPSLVTRYTEEPKQTSEVFAPITRRYEAPACQTASWYVWYAVRYEVRQNPRGKTGADGRCPVTAAAAIRQQKVTASFRSRRSQKSLPTAS